MADSDGAVHTQQLGLEWGGPQEVPSPMEEALATVRSSVSQATIYASQILSQSKVEDTDHNVEKRKEEEVEEEGEEGRGGGAPRAPTAGGMQALTVKKVLELLCEEAGFLLDEKLPRLMAPLPKEEQMMMKLDSMFKSLGVHTEEDIQNLVRYFVNDGGKEGEGGDGAKEEASRHPETGDENGDVVKGRKTSLIHPNNIPLAMCRYVQQRKSTTKPPTSHGPAGLGLLSTAQRELLNGSFWQQMTGVLPQGHELVWDALLEGLERYHSVLVSRAKCTEETKALGAQNNELRMLLQTYMHSRINEELEIPPTFMLPA